MIRMPLTTAMVLAFLVSAPHAAEYRGLCEASAGAFLDDKHFVVASDETNVLQLYERGKPTRIGNGIDLTGFTTFDKSDLEGAAVIGDRVYWISSHSFNRSGEDKATRKVFFATTIDRTGGSPTLKPAGKAFKTLRDPLVKALDVEPGALNIEALAATPEGGLIIGLRAPLRVVNGEKKAIAVLLKNPAAVVDQGSPPEFGTTLTLGLGGRGLRSMDRLEGGADYIIVAGPVEDGEGFAIYRWAGPGHEPVLSDPQPTLSGLTPEGAMAVPGQNNLVQLLSDDGKVNGATCDDENDPIENRKFRSIDVKP